MSRIDAERWRQISTILDGLLEAPPHERQALLDAACRGRPDLRREVQELLDRDASDSAALDQPLGELAAGAFAEAAGDGDSPETEFAPGAHLGPFRVVRELGRGGMGVVLLAERADGQFEQQVAIKIVRGGRQGSDVWRRFEQERGILASLQHRHIARLVDGGTTPQGDPYFVMEYIVGEAITTHCDGVAASLEERLRLFLEVCEAVQYAHRNLVVHRDLKPSNILVGAAQDLKLLDFGIAKVLDAESGDAGSPPTRVMTLEYAAPEQIFGRPVTTATDVYALGLLLCELLSGTAPRWQPAGVDLDGGDTTRWPPRPSALLESPAGVAVAGRRGLDPRRLARRLRGDLDAIVITALRVVPEQRYPSVEALAQDVRRHLDGLPIVTRSAKRSYRLQKFLRRHRVWLVASAMVVLAVSGGLVVSLRQTRAAQREARRAYAVKNFLVSSLKVAAADSRLSNPGDLTMRDLLAQGVGIADADLAHEPDARAEVLQFIGDMDRMIAPELSRVPLEKALAAQREIYGPHHPLVAETLVSLGILALNHREWHTAEGYLSEGVAILREHPTVDLPGALARLGEARRVAGALDDAEALERESLPLLAAADGAQSPRLALQISRLARVLVHRGRYAEAETELRRSLALTAGQGPGDLTTLNTMLALAQVLREGGERLDESAELYRRVETETATPSRSGSQQTAAAFVGRLMTLLDAGEDAAAIALFDSANAQAQSLMQDDFDYDEIAHLPEAVRRTVLVDPALGAARLETELVRLRSALPTDHPRIAEVLLLLGSARLRRDDPVAALAPLREALELRRQHFATGSWRLAEARIAVGLCLERLGRHAEGLELLREGLREASGRHAQHPWVVAARKLST